MVKEIFIAFLLCAGANYAIAQTVPPVDGIYWDPGQGGRGYAVETQDNKMFIAIYNYDVDSSPTFYSIQGDWDGAHRRINNASLLQVTSGPWIGASFSPVGQVVNKGPVVFEFPTSTTARFVFNGHTSNLQRFLYGYAPQANSLMRGAWHTTFGGSGLNFGDFLAVTGPCTIAECSSLPEAFVGSVLGYPNHVLVGTRLPDSRIMILLDSSTSYYSLYVFEARVNQWIGFENTFLKTATTYPTSGLLMIGERMLSPTDLAAISTSQSASASAVESMNVFRAQAVALAPSAAVGKSATVDSVVGMGPVLESVLEHLH
jgi:hypothetical protein